MDAKTKGMAPIIIDVAYPNDPIFNQIRELAKRIYLERWGTNIDPRPDAFAYAMAEGELIGCAAFTRASEMRKLPLEIDHLPDAFLKMTGGIELPRPLFAETGTRAVEKAEAFARRLNLDPVEARKIDGAISIALIAQSLVLGEAAGVKYICFTANRLLVRVIIRAFKGKVKSLGVPDDSNKSAEHRANWEAYMNLGRECFGFEVEPHMQSCRELMASYRADGFLFMPLKSTRAE